MIRWKDYTSKTEPATLLSVFKFIGSDSVFIIVHPIPYYKTIMYCEAANLNEFIKGTYYKKALIGRGVPEFNVPLSSMNQEHLLFELHMAMQCPSVHKFRNRHPKPISNHWVLQMRGQIEGIIHAIGPLTEKNCGRVVDNMEIDYLNCNQFFGIGRLTYECY